MTKMNKIVGAGMSAAVVRDVKTGHWKELNASLNSTGDYIVAFSFFDMQDVNTAYALSAHKMLVDMGFKRGIYEQKRSAEWEKLVAGIFSKITPVGTKELLKDRELMMRGFEGQGIRWAHVVQEEYMTGIFDIQVHERNGYFPDCGSAYVWEVMCVGIKSDEDGSVTWHPFHLTDEERAFKKECNAMGF